MIPYLKKLYVLKEKKQPFWAMRLLATPNPLFFFLLTKNGPTNTMEQIFAFITIDSHYFFFFLSLFFGGVGWFLRQGFSVLLRLLWNSFFRLPWSPQSQLPLLLSAGVKEEHYYCLAIFSSLLNQRFTVYPRLPLNLIIQPRISLSSWQSSCFRLSESQDYRCESPYWHAYMIFLVAVLQIALTL